MAQTGPLNRRFLETTRGQILSLIRREARTVEDLAAALELSDNAVRNHLSTLERDRLVRQGGVRRTSGAGKPAVLFELHPDAESLFSLAYPPVLSTVLETIVNSLPADQAEQLLRDVGRRLAVQLGGRSRGSIDQRIRNAAAAIAALGGDVDVVREEDATRIRGRGCPLSAAVSKTPEVCLAMETLVSEVAGANAQNLLRARRTSAVLFRDRARRLMA
jgi:predicted ArsR family transcriptional regulator